MTSFFGRALSSDARALCKSVISKLIVRDKRRLMNSFLIDISTHTRAREREMFWFDREVRPLLLSFFFSLAGYGIASAKEKINFSR